MGKAKRGRPKKAGERTKGGRLKPAHDYGNEKVAALLSIFAPFQGGKAGQWVAASPIGRAWAVGLLDGFDVDPAAIRDAGLSYAARYWGYYPAPSSVAAYGGESRKGSSCGDGEDPRGETFQRLDLALKGAGRAAYDAVQALVVNGYWAPDENPAWLDRLINERLLRQRGRLDFGALPNRGDIEMLGLAIAGLLTIVQGKRREAA